MASKKKHTEFSGIITPELRTFLRQRRSQLGVTLQQLSSILRVNWSTIRKWEDGQTHACRQQHIYRLARFIAGEYDEVLTRLNAPTDLPSWHQHPKGTPPMVQCIERISTIYKLCDHYPATGKRLIEGIQEILQEMAERLIGYAANNTSVINPMFFQENEQ